MSEYLRALSKYEFEQLIIKVRKEFKVKQDTHKLKPQQEDKECDPIDQ